MTKVFKVLMVRVVVGLDVLISKVGLWIGKFIYLLEVKSTC